jgi:5'-3' exonuclease
MGIPSYFSYIVRNHREIIKKIACPTDSPANRPTDSPANRPTDSPKINNLYLDCNSFIYEAHHALSKSATGPNFSTNIYEESIIKYVCESLVKMFRHLRPNKRVLIAFDGVAPMAKLDQQRNRRYMAAYQTTIGHWNTAAITPGTAFMQKLSADITARFARPSEFGLEQLMVSSSEEPGEGEHKIYEYIRADCAYHKETQTIIYGLDADLIMLTLNHLHISANLYLYRETPEFIKHIDRTLNPNENYLLDIPLFAKSIKQEMGGELNPDVLFDYILLCFFLGNDFLPHFPALNIRTTGINHLLNAYKCVFTGTTETLTQNRKIVWKNMRKFIAHLAENELAYIKEEYVQRLKLSKYATQRNEVQRNETVDENLMLPLKERAHELYINPEETGWETRYYKVLFNTRIDDERRKAICTNYLEGLEWTMRYYSEGCADWRWQYHYYYPPLLADLIKFVPHFDHTFVPVQPKRPVSPLAQLSYVLPPTSMGLIPYAFHKQLLAEQPDWYVGEFVFLWAFCKFFWEAHVELPTIPMDRLEELVSTFQKSAAKLSAAKR